ncbi:MAG: hypothetical protein U1E05_21400, partial [Patescibacteria group bacterium]|nr:hypothetical protein [Patescibacteria group bacterium]
ATAGDMLIAYDQADPRGYGPGIFQMQANARIGVARHESPTGRVSIFGTKARVVGGSWSTSLWIKDGAVISGIGYDSTLPGYGLLLPGPAAWKQHYPFIEWTHEQYGHTWTDASDPALPYTGPFTFFFVGPGLPVDDLNAFNAAVHDRFERIPWNVVPSFLPYTVSYGEPPDRPADQLTSLSSYDVYGGGSAPGGPVGNP